MEGSGAMGRRGPLAGQRYAWVVIGAWVAGQGAAGAGEAPAYDPNLNGGRVFSRQRLGTFLVRSGRYGGLPRTGLSAETPGPTPLAVRRWESVPLSRFSTGAVAGPLIVTPPGQWSSIIIEAPRFLASQSMSLLPRNHNVVPGPANEADQPIAEAAEAAASPARSGLSCTILPGPKPRTVPMEPVRIGGRETDASDYEYYLRLGREAFAQGDYRAAAGHFLNATFARSADPLGRLYYAMCQFARGDYPTAGRAVYRLACSWPALAESAIDVRDLYAEAETFERHLAALERAVERDQQAFLPTFLLACIYHSAGRAPQAAELFGRAAKLRPNDQAVKSFLVRASRIVLNDPDAAAPM